MKLKNIPEKVNTTSDRWSTIVGKTADAILLIIVILFIWHFAENACLIF